MTPLPPSTPVTRALDSLGIPYTLFVHPGPLESLEQAARERNQQPDQVVRSILFRLSADEFVMVLTAGRDQISWPLLRKYLGVSRLTLATRAELLERTGYEPGTVAPFGLPQPVRVLVDERVLAQEVVSLGSGVRGTAVILTSADLRKALGEFETGCFVECQDH
jgi:Cys-tRNA(Pro)/Cys-tRNA(Cys) deacylase